MEEQNKLIPINQNNLVQKVNTTIAITNKLIAENNRQLVKEIFERNPKLLIDLICMYYPLNNELLEMFSFNFAVIEIKKRKEIENVFETQILNYEYDFLIGENIPNHYLDSSFNDIKIKIADILLCSYTFPENKTLDFLCKIPNEEYLELKKSWSKYNLIDWQLISCNENIIWSIELIEKYNDKLDWSCLIKRINIPLNLKFIEKHINKINPFDISYNIYTWDANLLQLYEKHDIHYNWVNFIEYKGVILSEELIGYLINNFIHDFDWNLLWRIKQINIELLTIEKYKEKINWNVFSGLNNINWSIELIDKFIEFWDWAILSSNSSINWSIELIDKFIDYWDWSKLSSNNSLPINEIYKRYKEKTNLFGLSSNSAFNISLEFLKENDNFELNWHSISENEKIIWDIESLELYKSKIKWYYLSKEYKFTKEIIFKFDNYIDFKCLSNNKNVLFDYEIINRYEDRLNFYYLSWRNDIPWTEKLITDFSAKWNWSNLSNNESILWTKELISKFDNKLLFNFNDSNPDSSIGIYYGLSVYGLSSNKNTDWSNELIENYFERWNWDELSANENLPWSLELIEKYNEKWDWNTLSINKNLPWSLELIEKYIDKWNWNNLCYNSSLSCKIELIEKYKDKWDWFVLSKNSNIKWSLKLIYTFAKKIEASENIWEVLKDYVDDDLIKEVFENINS